MRHLPTLHRLLQAVKSTYRTVRGCEKRFTFFKAPFCFYFWAMTVSCLPSLSSRAELPVGIRTKGSGLYEDSESRDLPSPWGLLTTDCDFSTPRRSRGNDKKTGRAAVSIRSLSMKDGTSAVGLFNHLKGTPSFFHSPCIPWQRRRHPLNRAAERSCDLKSVILTQLKVKSNFLTQHVELKMS